MKTLISSIKLTLAFCVILFTGYVLVLWGFAWLIKPNNGQAELLKLNGQVVGAANVGQQFTELTYFWGRPSAVDYNAGGSGGSNKSVSNPEYLETVEARISEFLIAHPYLQRADLPSELVTASASGLDPHISPEAASVQIRRIAQARGVSDDCVARVVSANTHTPFIGQPYINVVELNIELDNAEHN